MSTKLEKICSRLDRYQGSHLWVVQVPHGLIAGYSSDFFCAAKAAGALNVYFRCPDAFKVCEA